MNKLFAALALVLLAAGCVSTSGSGPVSRCNGATMTPTEYGQCRANEDAARELGKADAVKQGNARVFQQAYEDSRLQALCVDYRDQSACTQLYKKQHQERVNRLASHGIRIRGGFNNRLTVIRTVPATGNIRIHIQVR